MYFNQITFLISARPIFQNLFIVTELSQKDICLTTSEFSFIFLPCIVVNAWLMLPLTVDSWKELPDAEVVLLLTKWSLIVNKGSWLETVEGAATETRPGVDGGVTCCCCVELWKFVKKPCVVVGTIADKSRLAAAAATAAETAVLKPAVVVGSGPRRSCNRK